MNFCRFNIHQIFVDLGIWDFFDLSKSCKTLHVVQVIGQQPRKQMKETFETNLSSSQKEEMANQKAYEELKAAKVRCILMGAFSAEQFHFLF